MILPVTLHDMPPRHGFCSREVCHLVSKVYPAQFEVSSGHSFRVTLPSQQLRNIHRHGCTMPEDLAVTTLTYLNM